MKIKAIKDGKYIDHFEAELLVTETMTIISALECYINDRDTHQMDKKIAMTMLEKIGRVITR